MRWKTLLTSGLLVFVAVSLTLAVADVAGWRRPELTDNVGALSTRSSESTAEWTAYFFHAPHRCPTCRKIEEYAHEALQSEIEQGRLAWQVADYTADNNRALVKQFQVMTSTVVLAHRAGNKIVRWKNLEEVWDHTHDRAEFLAFMQDASNEFRKE
jgi:hypothetical protein